jgi:hypothetical protein
MTLNATPPWSAAMLRQVPCMPGGPSCSRRIPASSSAAANRASWASGLGRWSAFEECPPGPISRARWPSTPRCAMPAVRAVGSHTMTSRIAAAWRPARNARITPLPASSSPENSTPKSRGRVASIATSVAAIAPLVSAEPRP